MLLLKNNEFIERDHATVDVEDRGYQFGDGVYEVIRIYNNNYFLLDEHLDRLQYSLNEVKIDYDIQKNQLKEQLIKLKDENRVTNGGVYVQISRGVAARGHAFPEQSEPSIVAYPITVSSPKELQQNGAKAILTKDIRWLRCDIKSLNLLGNVLAKQEAKDKDAFEAIQYRDETHVTEGSSTNVFVVKNGRLNTHPSNNYILNGITKRYLRYVAEKLSIPYEETVFSVDTLLNADEVFITSTTSEVVPIIQIDEHIIQNGKPGPITKQLLNAFPKYINLERLPEHI